MKCVKTLIQVLSVNARTVLNAKRMVFVLPHVRLTIATKMQFVVKVTMDSIVLARKGSTETVNLVLPGAALMLISVREMRSVLALTETAVNA